MKVCASNDDDDGLMGWWLCDLGGGCAQLGNTLKALPLNLSSVRFSFWSDKLISDEIGLSSALAETLASGSKHFSTDFRFWKWISLIIDLGLWLRVIGRDRGLPLGDYINPKLVNKWKLWAVKWEIRNKKCFCSIYWNHAVTFR